MELADNLMVYWIWLSLACTPGNLSFSKLLKAFSSPKEVYEASEERIRFLVETAADADALCEKNLEEAGRIFDFCRRHEIGLLPYSDPAFPPALRAISNPPVLLYYRGRLPDFSAERFFAVVGTRHLTSYGKRMAFSIGYDLARVGATVVSGMAVGIDGVAQAAALAGGGKAVAFLGCGINICYPAEHKELARAIVKNGCVMTEYPPGATPLGYHFPVRNRLISGLSEAVILVEGGERSGALITARRAKEQGKAVYAVPSNADNHTGAAANLLIREGAKLLVKADDVVRDFQTGESGTHALDPFALTGAHEAGRSEIDGALRRFKVCCVTADDPVFRPSRTGKRKKERKAGGGQIPAPEQSAPQESGAPAGQNSLSPSLGGIDKNAIALYHKIPVGKDCPIEFLADESHSLRDVTEGLLKLEMLHMIVTLPGDRVRRA